jgi:hypothetical protein
MEIKCKTEGCPGNVEYIPQEVILTLFRKALTNDDKFMAAPIAADSFSTAVAKIVKDDQNKFNSTKTAYLTCDFTGTGGPHTNAYQVPAK